MAAYDKGTGGEPNPLLAGDQQRAEPVELLTTKHRISSKNIIFEAMMRSGDAFGRPFLVGMSSLTRGIVQRLRQKSFFGFETFERIEVQAKNLDPSVNKFTRYGAAPFRGKLHKPPKEP